MSKHENHADLAAKIRQKALVLIHKAGGGHFGGTLSVVDIVLVVWRWFLRNDGSQRDRFILSKGHGSAALYCTLWSLGLMSEELLLTFGDSVSGLPTHPEIDNPELIDFSTGSLGQGLSAGLGMALIARKHDRRVWVVMGDGECQEGQVWEAAMLAARLGASNLIAIVDCNNHQEWGYRSDSGVPVLGLAEKWRAFGWRVLEVDGHDAEAMQAAFSKICRELVAAPSVVLAQTVKGYGVPLMVGDPDRFHCSSLTEEEFKQCVP